MTTIRTATSCPTCRSQYTRGGFCFVCEYRAQGRARKIHAERLRAIAAQITNGGANYRNALYAGAESLENDAANIEHVCRRLASHRRRRGRIEE